MKVALWTAVVLVLCLGDAAAAKDIAPSVQVYSRFPGEMGKPNTLICHVKEFHPPEITIKLMRNEKEMENAKQTDLAFEENWHYHLTRHADFTPNNEDNFVCEVTHMEKTQRYTWDKDM